MRACLSAAAIVLALTGAAWAQPGFPYNPPPAFSPYLNMGRGGNAAVNYYGVVRPQLETSRSLNQLQQQVQLELGQNGQASANRDPAAQGTVTGHAVSFMNTTHYFPIYGNRGGGAVGGGPGPSRNGPAPALPAVGGAFYPDSSGVLNR